ncbi:glycosyltransferase domain-containing protein [uncultured Draconibacterium sp.]|uniref:glycosyltransferase domain-containing protein n=1 Tax=uncultured Draconibacterium sp. TaxID=1573823 RepID=UPI0029C900FD|nr:glycosyltransferase domain-containing protein [uncultured Draconibacterium sp.]
MKKAIYTTLVGDYDTLKDPECIADDWDYICFSNNLRSDQFKIWEIRKIPFYHSNNSVLSRFPKLNPHKVLPEYDYSIYLDSNIQITGEYIYNKADKLISQKQLISIIKHPLRNCIYDEAEICKNDGLESKKNINELISFLKQENYPKEVGLFENNLIFRNHMDSQIINLSNSWWDMYLRFAKRDQLSLCYLLWKNKISCSSFMPESKSTRNHEDFLYNAHKSNMIKSLRTRYRILKNKLQ